MSPELKHGPKPSWCLVIVTAVLMAVAGIALLIRRGMA